MFLPLRGHGAPQTVPTAKVFYPSSRLLSSGLLFFICGSSLSHLSVTFIFYLRLSLPLRFVASAVWESVLPQFRRKVMSSSNVLTKVREHITVGASLLALLVNMGAPLTADAQQHAHAAVTPIQHVIVIIGENRSFDHVYATYEPVAGQT